jgi:uracil-DNA glycosylase
VNELISEIRNCKVCLKHLSQGCRPVVSLGENSKILIIGQAPGMKVHKSGIPWDDTSGNNLRTWLGVSKVQFYNTELFSIMPMGFCYPGTGKSGDLPPRSECAPLWHDKVLQFLPNIKLILLIGQYSQKYYLKDKAKNSLTETVQNYKEYLPVYFTLPHPSPRNNIWIKKNEWFEIEILPELKDIISLLITKEI